MITAQQLVEQVLIMEIEQPVYRTGGTGQDGTCDCIGMVMGSLYRLGQGEYPLHSSNYFARYQTENLHEISNAHSLMTGEVVYKVREDPSGLHNRYLSGGTHCTGDPRDYYHAGMVVSVSPLIIVHCTSSGSIHGFTRDESPDAWHFAGSVKGVVYGQEENETAVVAVSSGTTANLRIRPSLQSRRIGRIPAGTTVAILEKADGWAAVLTPDGTRGYMMTQFLKTADETIESRLSRLEARVQALERRE